MFGKHEKAGMAMANNATYVGKHENLVDSIAEIFEEVCSALEITADYIAEVTAPARKIAEKVTARVRKFVERKFPMPEIRIRWKFSGFWDARIYDMPVIYDGKRVGFRVGTV